QKSYVAFPNRSHRQTLQVSWTCGLCVSEARPLGATLARVALARASDTDRLKSMLQTQTRAVAPASPLRPYMARTELENYEVTSVPSKDNYSGAACSMSQSHQPQYLVPRDSPFPISFWKSAPARDHGKR